MHCRLFALLFAGIAFFATPAYSEGPTAQNTVYDYSLVDMDGKVVPLSNFKGKVLLIVNVASQSVFNSQLAALNDLQKSYGSQGLVILGIPSADFGAEELKDAAALRKYYGDIAHAEFSVMASATLTGVHAIPLYHFLCDPKESLPGGAVHWNYTKFLINRDGRPLARYEVAVDPADLDFRVTIESALAGKLKPQTSPGKSENESAPRENGDDDD